MRLVIFKKAPAVGGAVALFCIGLMAGTGWAEGPDPVGPSSTTRRALERMDCDSIRKAFGNESFKHSDFQDDLGFNKRYEAKQQKNYRSLEAQLADLKKAESDAADKAAKRAWKQSVRGLERELRKVKKDLRAVYLDTEDTEEKILRSRNYMKDLRAEYRRKCPGKL